MVGRRWLCCEQRARVLVLLPGRAGGVELVGVGHGAAPRRRCPGPDLKVLEMGVKIGEKSLADLPAATVAMPAGAVFLHRGTGEVSSSPSLPHLDTRVKAKIFDWAAAALWRRPLPEGAALGELGGWACREAGSSAEVRTLPRCPDVSLSTSFRESSRCNFLSSFWARCLIVLGPVLLL